MRRLRGLNWRISETSRRAWRRPLRGGTNFSTSSVKRHRPTRSPFCTAEKASSAAISAATSALVRVPEPKSVEAERSQSTITVSSRSSTNRLTWRWPVRAETFQSMARTSSPGA